MSAWLADVVLAATVVEFLGLALWRWRTGRGLGAIDLAFTLLPGVFLVLAMRMALSGSWWGWVALLLLAAGAAHIADLRHRAKA